VTVRLSGPIKLKTSPAGGRAGAWRSAGWKRQSNRAAVHAHLRRKVGIPHARFRVTAAGIRLQNAAGH
jgi:hypothetical protein